MLQNEMARGYVKDVWSTDIGSWWRYPVSVNSSFLSSSNDGHHSYTRHLARIDVAWWRCKMSWLISMRLAKWQASRHVESNVQSFNTTLCEFSLPKRILLSIGTNGYPYLWKLLFDFYCFLSQEFIYES